MILGRGVCRIWIKFGIYRVKWVHWLECEFSGLLERNNSDLLCVLSVVSGSL